jgi:hypothetical protein
MRPSAVCEVFLAWLYVTLPASVLQSLEMPEVCGHFDSLKWPSDDLRAALCTALLAGATTGHCQTLRVGFGIFDASSPMHFFFGCLVAVDQHDLTLADRHLDAFQAAVADEGVSLGLRSGDRREKRQ